MFRSPRPVWQIDMQDGTWAAACVSCRTPLGRGPKAHVARAARRHACAFVQPNRGRRGRGGDR